MNRLGQQWVTRYAFQFSPAPSGSGVIATVTDLDAAEREGVSDADTTYTLTGAQATQFEAEMCAAPADSDLDVICAKWHEIAGWQLAQVEIGADDEFAAADY